MRKRWNGYFSIEASLIMPIVLFLYLLIILAAIYLYCRCAVSQDTFLLGMRAGCFTFGGDDYGEVIYGQEKDWPVKIYVEKRLDSRKQRYPLYPYQKGRCAVEGERVGIEILYRDGRDSYVKYIKKCNPVRMIREGRKN